jgi:hypothetical protein
MEPKDKGREKGLSLSAKVKTKEEARLLSLSSRAGIDDNTARYKVSLIQQII